jgi:hypothetical protein
VAAADGAAAGTSPPAVPDAGPIDAARRRHERTQRRDKDIETGEFTRVR